MVGTIWGDLDLWQYLGPRSSTPIFTGLLAASLASGGLYEIDPGSRISPSSIDRISSALLPPLPPFPTQDSLREDELQVENTFLGVSWICLVQDLRNALPGEPGLVRNVRGVNVESFFCATGLPHIWIRSGNELQLSGKSSWRLLQWHRGRVSGWNFKKSKHLTQNQVFHVCVQETYRFRPYSFLCPNGTLFEQVNCNLLRILSKQSFPRSCRYASGGSMLTAHVRRNSILCLQRAHCQSKMNQKNPF